MLFLCVRACVRYAAVVVVEMFTKRDRRAQDQTEDDYGAPTVSISLLMELNVFWSQLKEEDGDRWWICSNEILRFL